MAGPAFQAMPGLIVVLWIYPRQGPAERIE